ncbi:hypothetical protein EW093_15485 [Thiospirochaeta perfilievii]|uniref:Uncharacterized protein n=1 Tax=Thiospirochaeta perfilievii TaxID=252967 RepID=A0A5C1QD40_9SPIO|nr:hypothetical protein [Thiospirochaeta perfilievii]QEN06033.1 hypothetical protein EW093_15485 [Thiospirochaeta perfilievii]
MDLNINNVNKKIVIFFSVFSFILSFISGIFAGSSFINLIFSSIISGVVIGLLIVALNFVVIIFLPELLEDSDQIDSDTLDGNNRVDIVMPEESYKVQSRNEDDDTLDAQVGEDTGDTLDSGFKEVSLGNLESLSSSDSLTSDDSQIKEDFSESDSFTPSGSSGSTGVESHSVEEMAKAVKTVLKKD